MWNLDLLRDRFLAIVERHRLPDGSYCRWLWQNDAGSRELGANEYGCADAANLLYTFCAFPVGDAREQLKESLLSMQDPETGLFTEATHHTIHTTAHCIAALELFDAKPRYLMKGLAERKTKAGLYDLLENLNWLDDPWSQSHQGAGIYAAMVLAGECDLAWQQDYFRWLWENTDPTYGMSRIGTIDSGTAPINHHLNGWFHYMFNMEYAHKPLRYPGKVVDTCIDMWKNGKLGDAFGRYVGFAEIDWVFVLNRALRQAPERFHEAKQCLREFAAGYIPWLESLDPETDDCLNDLHMLFGAACALAELQAALPGEVESALPLRLVLNRRPFI